jgi:hypothetical protein
MKGWWTEGHNWGRAKQPVGTQGRFETTGERRKSGPLPRRGQKKRVLFKHASSVLFAIGGARGETLVSEGKVPSDGSRRLSGTTGPSSAKVRRWTRSEGRV